VMQSLFGLCYLEARFLLFVGIFFNHYWALSHHPFFLVPIATLGNW
jgi:hypothetical protein